MINVIHAKGLVFALTSVFLFVSIAPAAAQTRLGLHHTAEEVAIWKQRSVSGPYCVRGDAGTNSPGDWDRILKSANEYIGTSSSTNYLSDRWNGGYQGSGYVPRGTSSTIMSYEPKQKIDKMMNAAFVYLLTGDTRYSSRVKSEILNYYIKHPLMDFSNRSRWGLGNYSVNDINPGFYTAAGLTKLLYAYDYVKDTFTESERALVNAWLYKAGDFFRQVVDEKIGGLYSDRSRSIFRDPGARAANTERTHDGGYMIPNVSHWYNNRRGDIVRFFTLVGIHLNDATMKRSGKLFFKEWMKFGIFPDGTMNEYYRSSSGSPEQGYQYSLVTVSQMAEIADAFAREGDFELYDYTTSEGLAATAGGNKNLKLVIQNIGKYLDRTYNRYFPGKAGNANYRIDGISPLEGKHYTFETWLAQANQYYKDSNFTAIYTRKKAGTSTYPSSAQYHGSYQPWSGAFGTYPGKLFMFGQMEGKVNPYDGTDNPPPPQEQSLAGFTLINADTGQPIRTLVDGERINLQTLSTRNLNIRADTSPTTVGSVVFALSGQETRNYSESGAPYALFGDHGSSYKSWTPELGSYTLTATPYSATGGTGTKGTPLTIRFTVESGTLSGQSLASFSLMNADTGQPIRTIVNGDKLNLETLPTRNLNIRANTSPATIGSVEFSLSGQQTRNYTESGVPYALFGDNGSSFNPWTPAVGSYTLTGTPYSGSARTGTKGTPLTVSFAVESGVTSGQSVISFTLMNADSERPIKTLVNGEEISLAALPTRNLNIRANTSPAAVGSVVFDLSGQESRNSTESGMPYALFGDNGGNYKPWTPSAGTYTLTATPYTASLGAGTKGTPLMVTFQIR